MFLYSTSETYIQRLANLTIFGCSARENIPEPTFYIVITSRSAVSGVGFRRFEIPTAMWDSESLIPSLLEVLVSSKHKLVFIYYLSDLTLQIIINAWWALIM